MCSVAATGVSESQRPPSSHYRKLSTIHNLMNIDESLPQFPKMTVTVVMC